MVSMRVLRLSLLCVLVSGAGMSSTSVQAGAFSSLWRMWYDLRQGILYPLDTMLLLGSTALGEPASVCAGLRVAAGYDAVPDVCNTGYPLATAQFGVGIIDAWLADKPGAQIIEEDVVGFASYIGFLVALDSLGHNNEDVVPSILKNNSLVKAITFYLKHKLARMGATVVSKPVGACVARLLLSSPKVETSQNSVQVTIDINGQKFVAQPAV